MGQATIEAQHIKQVIEEMAIPNINPHVTMSINTDSSAGKAVANRLDVLTKHLPSTTIISHLERQFQRLRLQTAMTSTVGSLLGVPTTTRLTIRMIRVDNDNNNNNKCQQQKQD
eukprot:6462452-Amphidinium_carterae.3